MTVIGKRLCRGMLLVCLCMGCESAEPYPGPVYKKASMVQKKQLYRLAVHPLHNPVKLSKAYQPLVDHLKRRIPRFDFMLEASTDYSNYEQKIQTRDIAMLLPNPWQTLQAMDSGYEVVSMAGEAEDFRGIFIARKDSPIGQPSDLKGQVVSYPAPTALAACIMPQYFLHSHGVDIHKDIANIYVGSQESSIMNAYLGKSAVGATWPPPWRAFQTEHPAEAEAMEVRFSTPPLLNNSFMVKTTLSKKLKTEIRDTLLTLHKTAEGRRILSTMETARFFYADNATYDVVRRYVAQFEKEVRRIQ